MMKKKFLLCLLLLFFSFGCGREEQTTEVIDEETPIIEEQTINVVDVNSNSRPYAIVVNNSNVAVKVQTGLNKAYLIYEFPVEGGLTRLMAFYKDVDDLTIGTIRSARHNFLDYALEQDAIFVSYGWSHYAEDDMKSGLVDYINGVVHSGPFWRDNPENLATEHTAYTSIAKLKEYATKKGFATTTDRGLVLNYGTVDLSSKENNTIANTVTIPAGAEATKFVYDSELKVYNRYVNGNANIDHETKEQFIAKNIIVQKINTKMASDNHYWDLETVGNGTAYYITNGVSVEIKWEKETRSSKTKYTYLDGSEVVLNDGITYIELQSNNQKLTIE